MHSGRYRPETSAVVTPTYYDSGMAAPGITRHRRPFLAPIWITALIALLAAAALFVGVRLAVRYLTDVSTVVVLRHAENVSSPGGGLALSDAGQARAARLAQMFGGSEDAGAVRLVISSDIRRARETAAPLAARLGLEVQVLPVADIDAVVRTVKREGHGLTSVVVGHSDTVPQIVAALSGRRHAPVSVDEGDYGSIFVVTVSSLGPARVLQFRY